MSLLELALELPAALLDAVFSRTSFGGEQTERDDDAGSDGTGGDAGDGDEIG